MKKILSLLLVATLASSVMAKAPAQHVSVNIDVNLQRLGDDNALNRYHIKHAWKIAANNHQWMVAQDQANNNDHIVLLSKIESADAEKVAIKFVVVDTRDHSNIISSPQMIVLYGKKGKLVFSENKQKMQLSVTATSSG